MSANYSCGPSISTSSATLQAGFRPELAPPVFVTANYDLCLNQTKRFTVEPVPSATSYQWTVAPANLTPNGTTTTTVPYLDVTAPNTDAMPEGEVTVRANASGGCLASAPTTKRFQIGIGTAKFTTSVSTYGYVCPDAPIPFHVQRFNARGSESYAWYVDGDFVSSDPTSFQVMGPPIGQNIYVQLIITNDCGTGFQFGRRIYGAAAIDGLACDVMRQGPTKPTTTAAYPNPADGQLTVEQGGGAAVLRNAYGQPVSTQTAKPGQLRLDTSHLPAGFYFLETRDAQGNAKRQQIRIEH